MIVQGNAFQNTSFLGYFNSVGNLRFEKNAFLGTKESLIEITDSDIGLLERMDASMKEIKLSNCRIDTIKSHTFDVVSINSIVLENCDIGVIESNFTTNKVCSRYDSGSSGSQLGLSGFDELQLTDSLPPSRSSFAALEQFLGHCGLSNWRCQSGSDCKQWLRFN